MISITNSRHGEGWISHWPDIISDYSDNLAEYRGKGKIKIRTNTEKELECEFKVIQRRNGKIISLCNFIDQDFSPIADNYKIMALSGETVEGYVISTEGPITITKSHLSGSGERQIIFLARSLVVRIMKDTYPATIWFGLTNFEFDSNSYIDEIPSEGIIISRQVRALDLKLEKEEIIIRQCIDYEQIIKKLEAFGTTDVTCEASMIISNNEEIEKKLVVINDVCHLISVARGTKINWIYYKLYNGNKPILIAHENRITKGFNSSQRLITNDYGNCNIKSFLEDTYSTYLVRKEQYQLDKGTIDAYLDAKAKGDFLEMRGAKLAIAMERLKSVYLDAQSSIEIVSNDNFMSEYIIDYDTFKQYRRKIEGFLKLFLEEKQIEPSKRGKIYKNISCINRTSFEDILRSLWKDVSLNLDDLSISLFVNSRNSLVHRGKFNCQIIEDKKCNFPNEPFKEYLFLVNILDKTILKILGYKGSYYNYYNLKDDVV